MQWNGEQFDKLIGKVAHWTVAEVKRCALAANGVPGELGPDGWLQIDDQAGNRVQLVYLGFTEERLPPSFTGETTYAVAAG